MTKVDLVHNLRVKFNELSLREHLIVEETVKELEQENAELKELKKKKEEIEIMTNFCKACKKMHTDQLAQAKTFLEEFCTYRMYDCDATRKDYEAFEELKKQAEQFLKEIEK